LTTTSVPRARPANKALHRKAARGAYHHGDLRRTLIEAALDLAREGGADAVTVREAARRAGVSPAAPFRHFPDRSALMTAVAEEASSRLNAEIDAALKAACTNNPLKRLHAVGTAYLRWVTSNSTHFQIVSRRDSINYEGSAALTGDNAAVQSLMHGLFVAARHQGRLRLSELRLAEIMCRAFVYGLARMHTDGHFPSWNVKPEEAEDVMAAALSLFMSLLEAKPAKGPPPRGQRRAKSTARKRGG
jgi:AcrR family transcriptional regulator